MTATGVELKEQGILFVSENRSCWLARVRKHAEMLIRTRGQITSDDLQAVFTLPYGASRNLWGAVFHDARFQCMGFQSSRRPSAHARTIRVWGLNVQA